MRFSPASDKLDIVGIVDNDSSKWGKNWRWSVKSIGKGRPVIHLGPVAIATAGNDEMLEPYKETFTIYGQRMAEQAVATFGA